MGIFQGNIFGAGENPFVTASRGELFVPIGDEEHPPLARRLIIIFLAVAVLISLGLFINQAYRKSITLPERNSGIIGVQIRDVEDVPDKVAYAGLEFDYEVTDFEGVIDGCQYTATGNPRELSEVIDKMRKCYGEPSVFEGVALSAMTEEKLAALDTATWTWDYGKYEVRSLEDMDNWGGNVAGYRINPTCLFMDLTVSAGKDGEMDIVIRYQARPVYG